MSIELDTATAGNFLSTNSWLKLGKPKLLATDHRYQSASKHHMPILGSFTAQTSCSLSGRASDIKFLVCDIPDLNLLGRNAIQCLGISIDNLISSKAHNLRAISSCADTVTRLEKACVQLCEEYGDLFKDELGCLHDYELEVEFQPDAKPMFCKPRSVPFSIQEDLALAYDAGISKGIWTPVQFCDWGTPVVPVRKSAKLPGQKAKLRVCGDYSVTVNPQLETHRHPLPLPENLMRKLGGGHGFTKIDLADAYNQIKLGPVSRKRLALSTHRGVLLQNVLPFGISSAPGYFQKIMDDLTCDLPGVAVYLDDILVSGATAEEHLENLRRLLDRLQSKGLRCNKSKCQFVQSRVEYLGHILSRQGISKGPGVNAVLDMPPPSDVSALRSFLGSVQFYEKFLPSNFASVAGPLYSLTRKNVPWKWGHPEKIAFEKLKAFLSTDDVLAHFDPLLPIGIACDASSIGIGATLFHRYPNGTERPIANVSKTLTKSQRNYSQIQKEALAIIFALKKFYQYLFGRNFILVTDHKPLISLFGPTKATPSLAANRLARWALFLSQFNYTIEYRKTKDHQNADALSRLPIGEDPIFDEEESADDIDIVCAIDTLDSQIQPANPSTLRKESSKDPVISQVMRFVREGWPTNLLPTDPVKEFQKFSDSLSTCYGCLLYGSRVVIPHSLRKQVLILLHEGHFGMQRMKQLARTAVYWPNIDSDIMDLCRKCSTCGEHQAQPSKAPVHPWMVPEKPWSRLHVDHAINFMGHNWLVLIDAYTKYPCIHQTSSVSTSTTINLLEQDFAHFGYPHTIVTDNATTFTSEEFQNYCKERGIVHLTGAPYHPATNGAAERMVRTFKQSLRKSSKPLQKSLTDFLIQYRRTPTSSGYSPSELLNNRQLRTKIDILLPSSPSIASGQAKGNPNVTVQKVSSFKPGDPCYALYLGPRRSQDPRWVPAIVVKVKGSRRVNVRVVPRGPYWTRHIDQLRPRYPSPEDSDPGDDPAAAKSTVEDADPSVDLSDPTPERERTVREFQPSDPSTIPGVPEYGAHNPRRSRRRRVEPRRYGWT